MSPGGAGTGGTLANLVVQFSLKGQEELQKSIQGVQNQSAALGNAFQAVGLKMQVSVQTVTKGIQDTQAQTQKTLTQVSVSINALADNTAKQNDKMQKAMKETGEKTKEAGKQATNLGEAFAKAANTINMALGAGIATITGFVRQGLAMGAMGQVLSFQMERLSLTISGLFRPEIQKITDLIGRLTDWINGLTESQKKMIAYAIQGAAAFVAVNLILPKIVSGIGAVISAVVALTTTIVSGEIATGFGAILPILGLLTAAISAFVVGTEQGRSMLGGLLDALKPILDAARSFYETFSGEFASMWESIADSIYHAAHMMAELVRRTIEFVQQSKVVQVVISFLAWTLQKMGMALKEMDMKVFGGKERPRPEGGDEASRGPDMRRTGGFESLSHTWERIALASIRATSGVKTPQQQTVDELVRANAGLAAIRVAIERNQSPIGR